VLKAGGGCGHGDSCRAAGRVAAVTFACADPSSPAPDTTPSLESSSAHADQPILRVQHSGTINRLQAISPVNSQVVWASGVGGTFVRTTDGGRPWEPGVVAGAELLQFRDVHGVSATEAYLLSAGVGEDSRLYKTVNGGASWTLQFKNETRTPSTTASTSGLPTGASP
jgi:photosystem II stability/assembly factor-like uncharacterized protein